MKDTYKLKLSEWTRYPGGRDKKHGPLSGEVYRKTFVEHQIANGKTLIIDLNDIFTIGWSFLDEAFGHYVPLLGETEWRQRFRFICDDDPDVPSMIEFVINQRLGRH
jgi:hypothetical protein